MKFLHSMIRVKDENEAIKFYCDFLGLKKAERIRLDDCYLQYLTDINTNMQIELTINDSIPENGYKTGDAFGHFAFECEDLDKITEKIKQFGYSWELEPVYIKEINTRISFINDPDGNSIELIEKKN